MKLAAYKKNSAILTGVLLYLLIVASISFAQPLPSRLLVGYWQNWSGLNSLPLSRVPAGYNVINVAFALPDTTTGAIMQFTPDNMLYPTRLSYLRDVDTLHAHGKKLVISVGGMTAPIQLHDTVDVRLFVNSMLTIIQQYRFDGLDIDMEYPSLYLDSTDFDFRNPTTPTIVHLIEALQQITSQVDSNFILSFSPEISYVQGASAAYGGVWGTYLPVIHALRNRLTYVEVQHYNTGSMFARDGNPYPPATADFHVAMAEMLTAGFNVPTRLGRIFFNPLQEQQVLIGLPACSTAANSGYTTPAILRQALNYLVLGNGFGGRYVLARPAGYRAFRGVMTWSINWDVATGSAFSSNIRSYLDSLPPLNNRVIEKLSAVNTRFDLVQAYPNPFNGSTRIAFRLPEAETVHIRVFNSKGECVSYLPEQRFTPGYHSVPLALHNFASGTYLISLTAPHIRSTVVTTLVK